MITRRKFIQYSLGTGAAFAFPSGLAFAATVKLNAGTLAKFVQPLPVPGAGMVVATASGTGRHSFAQVPITRQLHPNLPPTPLWAYDDGSGVVGQAGSFGMAVVAQKGVPLRVKYTNRLPSTYPSWIPVDTNLTPLGNRVRTMTHLHGGFVAAADDGSPAVSPNGFGTGETQSVYYPNEQSARLMWFHDHALGATRLNVFAGLAAAYILRDQFDTGLEPNPIGIPGGRYEIPLVIQDRSFNTDGTMLYPRSAIPGVTWIGEYFGDAMLVNGKVWPFLNVEPRQYRFRILNGCNARILTLDLGGPNFWQIGAEGGLFDVPVSVRQIVLAPAERADVIVDFSPFAGQTIAFSNRKASAPVSNPAPQLSQVMEFRVGTSVAQRGPTAIPATLPGERARLTNPVATRYITLNEVGAGQANWFLNLGGVHFEAPITERPKVRTVEDWVYINLTADTHPMHVHLVNFQVIGRTPFDVAGYSARYGGPNGVPGGINPAPYATGAMQPPDPAERGWKDTVKVNPGFYTTIRMKFDLPSGVNAPQNYAHHCHIVEHEDNDMMRPFTVVP